MRELAISLGVMAVVIIPYPLSLLVRGQVAHRRAVPRLAALPPPEPRLFFYPTTVSEAIGPLLVAGRRRRARAAAPPAILAGDPAALLDRRARRSSSSSGRSRASSTCCRSRLPSRSWPRGRSRLAPEVAGRPPLRAGRRLALISSCRDGRSSHSRWRCSSWSRIEPSSSGKFLAGSGGVPGGREAGSVDRHERAGGRGDARDRSLDGQHRPVLRSPQDVRALGQPQPAAPQPRRTSRSRTPTCRSATTTSST